MDCRNSSLLGVALALLALSSAVEAFDITKMLAQYPELSSFSQYLTETKLADQINSRQTITVLTVDNSGISSISGKPQATIKSILSTHVILDYFDEKKLMSTVQSSQTELTTLYQTTGPTNPQMGFIKVGMIGEGEIAFGSAVKGTPIDVELVRTVVTQPYNISILQVVRPIIAPGIDGQSSSPSASSPASSSTPKARAPSSAPKPKAPSSPSASETPAAAKTPSASSPSASETPAGKAPAASRKQISPSSEISPSSATSPSSETAPSSESSAAPEISPSPEEAESPLSDDAAPSDAPGPASVSSPRIQMGLVWAELMGFGALLVAM